jgi:hypothetical protein
VLAFAFAKFEEGGTCSGSSWYGEPVSTLVVSAVDVGAIPAIGESWTFCGIPELWSQWIDS